MSIENATIVGNLVADPELRYTPDGTAVASIRIASSRSVYNRNTGQREDKDTLFLTVNCWKQLGENIAYSLRKGQRVIATGRIVERTWESKEGDRRSRVEMTANAVGPDLRFVSTTTGPSQATDGGSSGGNPDPWGGSSGGGSDPWGGSPAAPGGHEGHSWGNQ